MAGFFLPAMLSGMERKPPLPLGTETQWGTVEAIGFFGERYYWLVDKDKVVSMFPADMVEASVPQQPL